MKKLSEFTTIDQRRKTLTNDLGISLKNISSSSLSEEETRNRNIENLIGTTQIPLGIAGPLKIHNSEFIIQNYYIPLATTEGALVASVNRGCKAINESGGVNTFVENVGITRGPVFKTKSLSCSFQLVKWIEDHFDDLVRVSQETSHHLKLLKIMPQIVGKHVFLRISYDTDQAMGMNMATIATDQISEYIKQQTGCDCLALSANACVDKKPAWSNFILGRGRKAWAEVIIPQKVVIDVLKTTPEKIYEVWLSKCLIGSAVSGSMAFNSHFANIIAAIFCATGQDLAHVVEGSLGITTMEMVDEAARYKFSHSASLGKLKSTALARSHNTRIESGVSAELSKIVTSRPLNSLYISVYLPDLIIGTIGGGTGLPTQKEALAIIFAKDKPDSDIFSQVIAGAVLAGELSLLASLAEGSLACSHQRLGRGK
ncbi:MAG: hydroxymethylglutaryl-CoA reductase [Candidatus Gottesmanbacteria bacterium]